MELIWEEVVENQAWTTSKGWRPCPISSHDPARFTNADYTKFRHPKDIPLPISDTFHQWVWCNDWLYTRWKYCKKWERNSNKWNDKHSKSSRCRRRKWKRARVRNNDETAEHSITEVVYENQRWLVKRWASPYLPKDRSHWSDIFGNFKSQGSINNKLPLNWKWTTDWNNEIIENDTDNNGWQYANDFNSVNWSPKRTILHHVRRRKFIRTRIRTKSARHSSKFKTRNIRTVSDAPNRFSLLHPNNNNNEEFDGILVVSYTNQFTLSWSTHGVIESSGYQCSIWKPKLGNDEYCLGYLVRGEKSYPTKTFLVIIKKNGSDPNAFARPTGIKVIWSTKFIGSSSGSSNIGCFYKPVPPPGYCALGDVAIFKKKSTTVTIKDFPKLVCIKNEFVDKYAEQFGINKGVNDNKNNSNKLIQPHTMIWNTKKLLNTTVNAQLWTQPPFSNEVQSPMFVASTLKKPLNVYPRLNIRYVLQDDPDNITIYAGYMSKKGKNVKSSKKRFFVLTSAKKLHYYETDECRVLKGTIDLKKMINKCRILQSHSERFIIPTKDRKWELQCNNPKSSIFWCNEINGVYINPKAVVNKIIAIQIQGQPSNDPDDIKSNDNNDGSGSRLLFNAPLNEQVIKLLLVNISIINKVLKNEHESIRISVLDNVFKREQQQQQHKQNKNSSLSLLKKASSGLSGLNRSLNLNSSLTTKNSNNKIDDDFIMIKTPTTPSMPVPTGDNMNQQSIYKIFDDAWLCVELLLKHFDKNNKNNNNSTNNVNVNVPLAVSKIKDKIPFLQTKSKEYIISHISDYVLSYGKSSIPDPTQIIKMCDACSLIEKFPLGQQSVINFITNDLLQSIKDKFAAGKDLSGCQFINKRFEEYRKKLTFFDNVYSFFIPSKWTVPVVFSLQFCKLTGEQIDEHLKKYPEDSKFVLKGKEICIEEEQKLYIAAKQFLSRPDTGLNANEIVNNLPQYNGMISSVLDNHLNSYIQVERNKAEECVLLAKNETFNILSEDGTLIEMYENGVTSGSTQKHKSCELLLVAIRQGFKKCIQISRGQQLVDILSAHQLYLKQYHDILVDLIREALEINNVICITSLNKKKTNIIKINKLTENYLWFNYNNNIDNKNGNNNSKKRDRNKEDKVIQQVLTFLVLTYNSSKYCKESMLNLGKAAYKAIEPASLKKKVDFQPLHKSFRILQFNISERLSQLIIVRIVQDIWLTYKSMDFQNMNQKNYVNLEKCRYLVESSWSNLAIQLLYIMPINHYKLMIKRSIYLFAEFLYESTLLLTNINTKIGYLLNTNYKHIKNVIITHIMNESQHLASEIESAANIIFNPLNALFDLLVTPNELIPAFDDDDDGHGNKNKKDNNNNNFDIFDNQLFDTIKTKIGQITTSDTINNNEPIYSKRYTQFEMKCVEFYHQKKIVLDFQTLLLQLTEHQIKLNRSAKVSVKPHFFELFNIKQYKKPSVDDKINQKEKLLHKIMECRCIDKDIQKKIQTLCRTKTLSDMKKEQHQSINEAMKQKEEWEKQQSQQSQQPSTPSNSFFVNNINNSIDDNTSEPPLYSKNSNQSNISISEPNDNIIIMNNTNPFDDDDNIDGDDDDDKKDHIADDIDELEKKMKTLLPKPKDILKSKPAVPSYRPPPPKPSSVPPPIPHTKPPATPAQPPPQIPSIAAVSGSVNKPKPPSQPPPPKPQRKESEPRGLFSSLFG